MMNARFLVVIFASLGLIGCADSRGSKTGDIGGAAKGPSTSAPQASGNPPIPARAPAASSGSPAEGEVMALEEHYPNGAVHIRREGRRRPDNVFVNHGTWVEFDENGQMLGEMTYLEGKLQGPITLWHPNGQKNGEGFFENGEKAGTWQIWDEQGRKIREEGYKDNAADGMWIYWDEEGNIIQYEHWVKGERQLETKSPATATQPGPVPASPPG